MCSIWLLCLLAQKASGDLADLIGKERALLAERAERGGLVAMGADPFRIGAFPGGELLVLARGGDVVLVMSPRGEVRQRLPAPREPIAFVLEEHALTVVGARDHRLARYSVASGRLGAPRFLEVPGAVSPRDLCREPETGTFYLSDVFTRELIRLDIGDQQVAVLDRTRVGPGPQLLSLAQNRLTVTSVLEGRIRLYWVANGKIDGTSVETIVNDGPVWSSAICVIDRRAVLAAGGIENHPLERTGGGFGYVDSFLYLYDITDSPRQLASLNLSELGVVTPKHLSFSVDGSLIVAGFGSIDLLRFEVGSVGGALELRERIPAVPGMTDLFERGEALFAVSSLTDRVYMRAKDGMRAISGRLGRDDRTAASRLGEALLFTTLIAPGNSSEGGLSRFTCEACHFEGEVDGRVHFTGRDDVHATPKTLRGLAGTVPLFSSGGDDTMAKMVEAEVAVANQGDPRFSIKRDDHPWLGDLAELPDTLEHDAIREALLAFLIDFEHAPNPWLVRNQRLDEDARAGLEVFREHCEDCHQAVPSTRGDGAVPFGEWDDWLEDPARDLVWAAPFYYKTGVEPYFDPAGTQVPSLRRIESRYPYFSDGSAADLDAVLDAFRYRESQVWHRGGPEGAARLSEEEVHRLRALLRFF